MVEEQGGHGRDQEDRPGTLGLHHVEPAFGVEPGHGRWPGGPASSGCRRRRGRRTCTGGLACSHPPPLHVRPVEGDRASSCRGVRPPPWAAGGARRVHDVGQVPGSRAAPGSRSRRRSGAPDHSRVPARAVAPASSPAASGTATTSSGRRPGYRSSRDSSVMAATAPQWANMRSSSGRVSCGLRGTATAPARWMAA